MCTHLFHQFRIPGTGLAQRNLVKCLETVDIVVAEKDGNSKAGLLHRPFLHGVAKFRIGVEINEGADFSRDILNLLPYVVHVVVAAQSVLVQLHHLLVKCHPGKQVVHPKFFRSGCILINRAGQFRDPAIVCIHHIPSFFLASLVGQQSLSVEK